MVGNSRPNEIFYCGYYIQFVQYIMHGIFFFFLIFDGGKVFSFCDLVDLVWLEKDCVALVKEKFNKCLEFTRNKLLP